MSEVRHTEIPSDSLIGFGYLPALMPAYQVARLIGIRGGIFLRVCPRMWKMREKPVCGMGISMPIGMWGAGGFDRQGARSAAPVSLLQRYRPFGEDSQTMGKSGVVSIACTLDGCAHAEMNIGRLTTDREDHTDSDSSGQY